MKDLPIVLSSPEETTRRTAALRFLLDRINYEQIPAGPYSARTVKLDRMRTLLNRLGRPDAGMPIVHVAGTKGKGSTSTLIASMLEAADCKVGVFSSPHLERIEERFCLNGRPCDGATLVALVDRLRPVVTQMDHEADQAGDPSLRLTFFELNTAAALLYFADQQVDIAVLEVGLGGRLDATNVCQSIVSVVTSISLDHTRQLGNTLEAIAREKAGIVKPGVPVIIGPMAAGPRGEILQIAHQRGARAVAFPDAYHFDYRPPREVDEASSHGVLEFTTVAQHLPPDQLPLKLVNVPLGLLGAHQAANAAVALATIAELRHQGWSIPTEAMQTGLAEAMLPGRVEVVRRHPTVVLDVAHNAASAEALVKSLRESFSAEKRLLLLAATRDKDVRGIARILLPHFDRVFVTSYQENPRGLPVERLAAVCRKQIARLDGTAPELTLCATPAEACRQILSASTPRDLVCMTGSFFIVAELRGLVGE